MTKFLKILTIIVLSVFIIFAALYITYAVITKDAVLKPDKLIGYGQNVTILDSDGNEITSASIEAQKKKRCIKKPQRRYCKRFHSIGRQNVLQAQRIEL